MLLKPAFHITVAMLDRKVAVPWGAVFAAMGVAVLLGINAWMGAGPHGSAQYGVCRTFLDMYVRYPTHIVVNEVAEGPQSVRIEYVEMDAAGSRQTRQIECSFGPDKRGNQTIKRIAVNRGTGSLMQREPIADDQLLKFRMTLPIVLGAEPNTLLPDMLFKIRDGEIPTAEQLLSLQRLNDRLLAK